jgi:hypothetical protein
LIRKEAFIIFHRLVQYSATFEIFRRQELHDKLVTDSRYVFCKRADAERCENATLKLKMTSMLLATRLNICTVGQCLCMHVTSVQNCISIAHDWQLRGMFHMKAYLEMGGYLHYALHLECELKID